jgi:AhpC/TSA family
MTEGRSEGNGESRGPVPGLSSRYTLLVGIAFIALVAVAALNTLRTSDSGILGTDEVRGERLPEFAVPDIRGELDLDANITQTSCETSERPCPEDARQTPACEIDPEGAIRVCDLFDRPLVLSFWFTSPDECPPTQDAVAALARRFRDRVNFLSIAVRGDRDEIEQIVDERGWDLPVGWDRDGAVSNIYRVGVCPTVVFAFPGGIFQGVALGDNVSEPALIDDIERLLRESREREGSG